jgi:uncharacterized protein YbaA (DUF1428 family)
MEDCAARLAAFGMNLLVRRRRKRKLLRSKHPSHMPHYIDGFVLPVPKDKVEVYRRMAAKAGKVWREHGALEYRECVGDDLDVKQMLPFPRMARTKSNETVVFAWIVFKSRKHRDEVNARVMKDRRLAKMMDAKAMPFDSKRMAYGGFKTIVEA